MLRIGVISRLTLDILFSGLDHLPCLGEEMQAASLTVGLGGGLVVTAVLMQRVGIPMKLGTFLDDSLNAKYAIHLLNEHGITEFENLYEGGWMPVTISTVLSLKKDRSIVSYEEPCRLPDQERLLRFFEDCDVALMPVLPELAIELKRRGKAIVLDVSDFDAPPPASYLALLDVITPNMREACAITGEKEPERALLALAEAGVKHPIIKLGEDGCLFISEGKPTRIAPITGLPCVDTTGAGDNFMAGLMYGYLQGWAFEDSVRMGNVFGGLSATAPGVLGANISEQAVLYLFRSQYALKNRKEEALCVG